MGVIRSALTLTSIRNLKNYKAFIYQDRDMLLRERRQNLNSISSTATLFPILHTVSLPQPLEFLREVNDPEDDDHAFDEDEGNDFDEDEGNDFDLFNDDEIEDEEIEQELELEVELEEEWN